MPKGLVESIWNVDLANSLPPEDVIFGHSAAMKEIQEKVRKVADTEVPVLVRGESGTGKELIARFLHANSVWKSGPFVKLHCPAIPESALESDFLGHEEGSFAWVEIPHEGQAQAAKGGTLLLDEVAELGARAQATLLRVLQDGQLIRIGATEQSAIPARIICTTHRPIEQDVRNDTFRPELFYRLSVVTLPLPALRERREDIPQLTDYFLDLYSRKNSVAVKPLSSRSMQLLQESNWPGNIRELENLINRYVILGDEEIILHELVGAAEEPMAPDHAEGGIISLRSIARQAARAAERKLILQVLNANQGNRKKTARLLNISYRSLLYKIKDAGIPRKGAQEHTPSAEFLNDTHMKN